MLSQNRTQKNLLNFAPSRCPFEELCETDWTLVKLTAIGLSNAKIAELLGRTQKGIEQQQVKLRRKIAHYFPKGIDFRVYLAHYLVNAWYWEQMEKTEPCR